MKLSILLTLVACALLSGCALIISGKKQDVYFKSNVDGAKVACNLDNIGYTNQSIEIPRGNLVKLYTISKDGCRDTSIVLPVKFNPVTWLDVPLAITIVGSGFLMFDYVYDAHLKTNDTIYVNLDCRP